MLNAECAEHAGATVGAGPEELAAQARAHRGISASLRSRRRVTLCPWRRDAHGGMDSGDEDRLDCYHVWAG